MCRRQQLLQRGRAGMFLSGSTMCLNASSCSKGPTESEAGQKFDCRSHWVATVKRKQGSAECILLTAVPVRPMVRLCPRLRLEMLYMRHAGLAVHLSTASPVWVSSGQVWAACLHPTSQSCWHAELYKPSQVCGHDRFVL